MSAAYVSRYEAVFLCSHPKGPKMSYGAAAKYMKKSKAFVSKWVKRYSEVKNASGKGARLGLFLKTGIWHFTHLYTKFGCC